MILRAALISIAMIVAGQAQAEIVSARYGDPTTRYAHGILGDDIEYGALILTLKNGKTLRITLPQSRVFEDTEPRLADLDGDGNPEVIVVETDMALGAQLSVYGEQGKIAATPNIGRSNRWLAPVGAADLDGDGFIEIAYVDRPHLAKILRVWRFRDGALTPVAQAPDLTNHAIGEPDIGGGIRDCGQGPEMITASADWSKVMATRLKGGGLTSTPLGPYESRASFRSALACQN